MRKKNALNIMKMILMFFVLFSSKLALSQIEYPEDKVKWKFSVEQKGDEATVIATVKMETHWHINSIVLPKGVFGLATTYKLDKANSYKLIGNVIEPKPIVKHDEESDEDLCFHEGKVKFKQKIKTENFRGLCT